jgi:hypothetical protein
MTEPVVGSAPEHVIPQGDPNLIRTLQHYLDLARRGEIAGIAIIGLAPQGGVYATPCLPSNPTAMQLAMGALLSLANDIDDSLKQFKKQVSASPIIRPGGLLNS